MFIWDISLPLVSCLISLNLSKATLLLSSLLKKYSQQVFPNPAAWFTQFLVKTTFFEITTFWSNIIETVFLSYTLASARSQINYFTPYFFVSVVSSVVWAADYELGIELDEFCELRGSQ